MESNPVSMVEFQALIAKKEEEAHKLGLHFDKIAFVKRVSLQNSSQYFDSAGYIMKHGFPIVAPQNDAIFNRKVERQLVHQDSKLSNITIEEDD